MEKKIIKVNDDIYKRIISYAKQKDITVNELLKRFIEEKESEYTIKKEENSSLDIKEDISNIFIEDTGLFNYKGNQSSVYSRFKNNNIKTIKNLLDLYDKKELDYGKDRLNDNYYIHSEIEGIIRLIKYKYINEKSNIIEELLNFKIKTDFFPFVISYDTGRPGKILRSAQNGINKDEICNYINSLYKTLKSLGFNQTCTKFIIDYSFKNRLTNISIKELLEKINLDCIEEYFSYNPNEFIIFNNINRILLNYINNIIDKENENIKKSII